MILALIRYSVFRGWAVLTVVLLGFVSTPVSAASAQNDRVSYTVKRGDTLIELADKYFRKRTDYRIVQRLNRIKNPRLIPIGKRISIPLNLLKYRSSTANIAAFRGNGSIIKNGRNQPMTKGLSLTEGTRISTAAASFVTLRLEDGSRVSMPSNSRVRVSRLRHILLTDSVDYEFSVENGRVRSKIVPFKKKADRYRVRTPIAVSAVRGTDYRTRVDELSGTVFSETVEGEVEVANNIGRVLIPSGTGAAATVSGNLAKASLLSPPEFADAGKVQSDEKLSFAIVPRELATGHRILVSSDAGFVDIVAEQSDEGNDVELTSIPDGRYFAKATAISDEGFEGMPATYAFKRQLSTLTGSAGQGDFGYRFKWDGEGQGERIYRFQLLRESKTAVPLVDEAGLSQDVITLSEMPEGIYYWRVGVTQISDGDALEKWTDFEKLTVAG